MTVQVGWLDPKGQWDTNMLDLLLTNKIHDSRVEFDNGPGFPSQQSGGGILVIPGRFWNERYDEINERISPLRWVLAMRVSDEEDWFDISKIEHPNLKWWVQTPRTDKSYGDAHFFGVGFTPHFNQLSVDPPRKSLDVFLSGQNTHSRRAEAFEVMNEINIRHSVHAIPTEGFTQGLAPEDYATWMSRAKVAVCPSGAVTPDSFRLYEALQAHAVPIADDLSPVYDSIGYWDRIFSHYEPPPFPIFTNYGELPDLVDNVLSQYPRINNLCADWWMGYKIDQVAQLKEDLEDLMGAA